MSSHLSGKPLPEARWEGGYSGTFIEQYLEPVLYPAGFTPSSHLFLGFLALVVNVVLYVYLWQRVYRK